MAAGSALKKITTRAKHIRHLHGGSWKAAIKKAGAEYRAGSLGRVVTMHRKKRATKKRRRVGGTQTGVLYRSSGKRLTAAAAVISGRPYNGMVGGAGHSSDDGYTFRDHYSTIGSPVGMGGVKKHINHAKHLIEMQIGNEEIKKLRAKTKTAKRKIAKKIAKHKVQLRKLC